MYLFTRKQLEAAMYSVIDVFAAFRAEQDAGDACMLTINEMFRINGNDDYFKEHREAYSSVLMALEDLESIARALDGKKSISPSNAAILRACLRRAQRAIARAKEAGYGQD